MGATFEVILKGTLRIQDQFSVETPGRTLSVIPGKSQKPETITSSKVQTNPLKEIAERTSWEISAKEYILKFFERQPRSNTRETPSEISC